MAFEGGLVMFRRETILDSPLLPRDSSPSWPSGSFSEDSASRPDAIGVKGLSGKVETSAIKNGDFIIRIC